MKLIMKSEFDDLKNNDNHLYESDINGDKQVLKIYCENKLIAKKIKLKKSIRYFAIEHFQQYLSSEL